MGSNNTPASFSFTAEGEYMDLYNPSLLWFIAGIALFLLEMMVPGFILFFFGAGACITSLATLLFGLSLNSQVLVFIIASLLSLAILRRYVKKAFIGKVESSGEDSAFAEKGAQVEVVGEIVPPAEGKVKYSGTTWRAKATERIEVGEIVQVIEQDGLIMTVKKLEDA